MGEPDDIITINIKIRRETRDRLKRVAKQNRSSMQSILRSLAENYIENSEYLKLKMVDTRGENGQRS
jgi:predicted DNA-binding protein